MIDRKPESKKSKRRKAQRNEDGELCFRVGILNGSDTIEGEIQPSRIPKNDAEAEFSKFANSSGWTVTKRGWPDFLCVKGNEVCCVEVKPKRTSILKQNQIAVMGILASAGIKCYMWSPDGGFEEVKGIE